MKFRNPTVATSFSLIVLSTVLAGAADKPWKKHVVHAGERCNTAVAADFTGDGKPDIIANSGGITVIGNDSAGVSVETALDGSIATTGTIAATGDRSFGLHTTGPVSGSVTVGGALSATGQGAQGVAIGGDVGGGVVVNGAITATGYRYTTRPTTQNKKTMEI